MKILICSLILGFAVTAQAKPWKFAVSGDSRNCGDVVMPTIATSVASTGAQFYLHLGDFRYERKIDEDLAHDSHRKTVITEEEYKTESWKDFIANQITPFGKIPVYLAIGNHELFGSRTRAEYIETFKPWLAIGENKVNPKIYYRFKKHGVDFIILDNASNEQFDEAQMSWFRKVIAEDEKDPKIKTVIVGMHEALPDSISFSHSMSESDSAVAVNSGREVYKKLLHVRDVSKKYVYVLASHSHFYMDGTFNTDYWRTHGGVLDGWIIGTAGAIRYALPENFKDAKKAKTNVYGYLLATVKDNGETSFAFQELVQKDVSKEIATRYGADLVKFCFDENKSDKLPGAPDKH